MMIIHGMQGRTDLNGMTVDARSDDGTGERARVVVVQTGERVHVRRTTLVSEQAYLRQCVDGMIVAVEEAHTRAEQAREAEEMEQEEIAHVHEERVKKRDAGEMTEWDIEEAFRRPYRELRKHVLNDECAAILAPIAAADNPNCRTVAATTATSLRTTMQRYLDENESRKREAWTQQMFDIYDHGGDVCPYEHEAEMQEYDMYEEHVHRAMESVDSTVATAAAHAVLARSVFVAWKGVAMARAYAPGVGVGFKRALAEFQVGTAVCKLSR